MGYSQYNIVTQCDVPAQPTKVSALPIGTLFTLENYDGSTVNILTTPLSLTAYRWVNLESGRLEEGCGEERVYPIVKALHIVPQQIAPQ